MEQVTNEEVAVLLYEIAFYLELSGDTFRPRSFERAARSIETLSESVMEIHRSQHIEGLMKIPFVGEGIAKKIDEKIRIGRVTQLEELKVRFPVRLSELLTVESVGPKTVRVLYEQLDIKNVEDLEKRAREGKIRSLPGFGNKSEEKILKGIEFLKACKGRQPLGTVLGLAQHIRDQLRFIEGVKSVVITGSLARGKETVEDLDLLAITSLPDVLVKAFISTSEVIHVYQKQNTRVSIRLKIELNANLRIIPEESFGAAQQYFTGSKEHNLALQRLAQDKGLKLNEYGVFSKDGQTIAGTNEEGIYTALGLPWIPPELRENLGEIEAAREERLPDLIKHGSLRGDLQTQTNWTDGKNSIEEMGKAARELGLQYIAITDHTRSLAMVGGLDESKIQEQGREIERVNRKLDGIQILKGAEVNILKDGSLDLSDDALADLDVVGAAVHTNFNMPQDEMTRRMIQAIRNPHVDIIFHPTGRIINRRPPYAVNMKKIIEAAKDNGTILEIDAYPERLDLKDEHIRMAVDEGVKLCIDSDAHSMAQINYLSYGITQARRGWASRNDIVNTMSLDELLKHLS